MHAREKVWTAGMRVIYKRRTAVVAHVNLCRIWGSSVMDEAKSGAEFAIGNRVRVRPGEIGEARGTVAEDFGEGVGVPVTVGAVEIARPARRWAVVLDSGELKCFDSDQLAAE